MGTDGKTTFYTWVHAVKYYNKNKQKIQ